MRILRIVSAGYEQGGAENGVNLTNTILKARGHEILTISSNTNLKENFFSDIQFKSIPEKGLKHILYAAFNPDAYRIIKSEVNHFNPDVVLLHTMSQSTASAIFACKGFPVIQFVHGPEIFTKKLLIWYLSTDNFRIADYKLYHLNFKGIAAYSYLKFVARPLYLISFRHVTRFIGLSNFTRDTLKSDGIDSQVIPNGIKLFSKKNSINSRNTDIIYVGRLEQFKGLNVLLDAMFILGKDELAPILHIVGTGSLESELKNKVKERRLDKLVKFHGKVKHSELQKLYNSVKITIMPSLWPETFGKTGVESMSCGTPVIATNVGGINTWLRDGYNGYFVPVAKPDELARKIKELLADKDLLKRFSKNSLDTSRNYSIEKFAQNIETICEEVAA